MEDNKKPSQVAGTTSEDEQNTEEIEILNYPQVEELVDNLAMKLKEAREIASQLASVEIIIKDTTRKDILEYEQILNNEFKKHFNCLPKRIVLRAESGFHAFEISLTGD